jgi:hypothetical protein
VREGCLGLDAYLVLIIAEQTLDIVLCYDEVVLVGCLALLSENVLVEQSEALLGVMVLDHSVHCSQQVEEFS